MKIKIAAPLLVLTCAIGLSASARAADYGSASSSSSTTAPTSNTQTISGTVQNVDTVNNTVQVKDNAGILETVKVDESTQIQVQGKTETLNDLKIGDVATIKTISSNRSTM